MNKNEQVIRDFNDLIRINNDRVAGYEKAIGHLDKNDADIKEVFMKMANQSRQFSGELAEEVRKNGGEAASGNTASGKIYHVWMDIKAGLSGNDRQTMLNSCEFGEDAILNAYATILEMHTGLPKENIELISRHRNELRNSHDLIKKYRDNNIS